jgi:hypothetical protein
VNRYQDLTLDHLHGLIDALEEGGGTHKLEHVFSALREGTAQLWIDGPCVVVTEVNDTPRERELQFWLAAGTLDEVIHLSNKVMKWGREQGCTVASLCGRRGWAKALRREGWNHQMIVMGQRLDGQG